MLHMQTGWLPGLFFGLYWLADGMELAIRDFCTMRMLMVVYYGNGVPTWGLSFSIKAMCKSNVWWTLVVMGVFFAPMLIYGMVKGVREGAMVDSSLKDKLTGPITILAVFFPVQWVVCLGLAVLATVIVINLGNILGHIGWGYLVGLPLRAIVYYFVLFRKEMLMDALAKILYVQE